MKPGTRRYTVEMLASGQPRAYADTIHKFRVSVEWVPYKNPQIEEWEPNELSPALIDKAAKALGYPWEEKGQGDWASPRLHSKTKIAPGVWEYTVVEAYTD